MRNIFKDPFCIFQRNRNFDIFNKDEFFKWHHTHVHESSVECGRKLIEHFKIPSLIDFGCGIGSFLEGAHGFGGVEVKGFEIGYEHALPYISDHMKPFIEKRDLTEKIKLDAKYYASLCLEVAEHIETRHSSRLVENICNNTYDLCFFTAAPPDQDGCGHINCQPSTFWKGLFMDNGWRFSQDGTGLIKDLWQNAADYYVKNLMVFVRG